MGGREHFIVLQSFMSFRNTVDIRVESRRKKIRLALEQIEEVISKAIQDKEFTLNVTPLQIKS